MTRTAITVYEATDGSLHRDKKAWRARQCWLDLVEALTEGMADTDLLDAGVVEYTVARLLLANRADIIRLLRHAEEPTP